ncbi:MAG TPA: HD domain-containing protein, partial [Thermoanaerobaculia bacterium]|nr:HD domain-containing protein [Thermoanaerobaculia bacterium]
AWILKATGAESIVVGERGVREGILLDHVPRHGKRSGDRDLRSHSVERLLRRTNTELPHAERVARLAVSIFDQTHALHQLTAAEREWLRYGALLHDVGCSVGIPGHQRHSYYLITHGELTGFSADEIEAIASVARYHKGKGPKNSHDNWKRLDAYLRVVVEKLAAILRIADGLDHSHRQLVTDVACRLRPKRVEFDALATADCQVELEAARGKSDLFERVFGREPAFRAVPAGRDEAALQKEVEPIAAAALWG